MSGGACATARIVSVNVIPVAIPVFTLSTDAFVAAVGKGVALRKPSFPKR